MSNRIDTPLTNEHFAAYAERMLGRPYWYGTVVYNCTEDLRARKARQYPSHYKSSRTARYKKDIAAKEVCADCIGLMKGYVWAGGDVETILAAVGTGSKIPQKYGVGAPDMSANGMLEYARKAGLPWGTIDTIPEVPGVGLHKDGHAGIYLGDGWVVEERGFDYGCVKTRLKDRGWEHWYAMPGIDYGDADMGKPGANKPAKVYVLGERLLKSGVRGEDVERLQELLAELGYAPGEADGIFGGQTERAVRALQERGGLEVDGIYGKLSHAELMAQLQEMQEGDTGELDAPAPDETYDVHVFAEGRWNIRKGPGTNYGVITVVSSGTYLEFVDSAAAGWLCVRVNGQVGWISTKAARVERSVG